MTLLGRTQILLELYSREDSIDIEPVEGDKLPEDSRRGLW